MRIGKFILCAFALLTLPVFAQPPMKKPACDRACLIGYVDKYIAAMLAKKVDDALFAREVKYTENGVRLPLGNEGAWFLSTGRGKYRFYVPDVETMRMTLDRSSLRVPSVS